MPEEYKKRIEASRPRFNAVALQQYGLVINSGPSGQNSRPALVGAKYAEEAGRGEQYHARVLRAMWHDAARIDDLVMLSGLAVEAGLNQDEFMQALERVDLDELVTADVDQARDYGLNGVPAIVINNRYLISGAQPYEVIKEAVDKVRASQP